MSQGAESLSELNVLTSKRTKKRISFLQSVVDRIEEAIYSECLWKDRMSENIEYKAGWIEISMNRTWRILQEKSAKGIVRLWEFRGKYMLA